MNGGNTLTKYGEQILTIVMRKGEHPTAEQVFMEMKVNNPKIAQGTVYNNLNALADEGRIIRISEPGFPDRFDNTTRHDHMVCIKCGRLADVKLPDFTEEIERNSGEKIISYDLRIRYICPECRNKTDK
mgnify:FL=1